MPFIRRPVTLNHGVVGSNPAGLTNKIKGFHDFPLTFVPKNSIGEHMGNKGSTWETNLHRPLPTFLADLAGSRQRVH